MSEKRGCLKTGLFGCLGIFVILILLVGGGALVAWNKSGDRRIEDKVLTPEVAPTTTEVDGFKVTEVPAGVGLVLLDLADGEFEIHPAPAGSGLRVAANYDSAVYALEDYYEARPDSSWVYGVRSRSTISGLHAALRSMMGAGYSTEIDVYLPADSQIELRVRVAQGGFEADLGGLWITNADFYYNKGGFSLAIDEPLREPMDTLTIRGSMGGFEASRLGNASPRLMFVQCKMGGADIDLRGDWARDAAIDLEVLMGGIGVRVPEHVRAEGVGGLAGAENLVMTDSELPQPVLRFNVKQKMGEIELY
jgi:hypothetical protein